MYLTNIENFHVVFEGFDSQTTAVTFLGFAA
jgi:hypothetical protein